MVTRVFLQRTSHRGDFVDLTTANAAIAAIAGGVVEAGLIWKCRIDGHEYVALPGESVFTSVITPWEISATGQLEPTAADIGVGGLAQFPSHVVLGDTLTGESEGMLIARPTADGGGLILAGAHAFNPAAPEVNAPIELAGSVIFQSAQSLVMETQSLVAETRYLTLGPGFTGSDGRHWAPMQIGPIVVFSHEQLALDSRSIQLNESGPLISVVSLTTNDIYPVDSVVQVFVQCSEQGGRNSFIDIVFQVGGVEQARSTVEIQGGQIPFNVAFPVTTEIASGVLIDVLSEFTETNPQSDCWIRGDIATSTLAIRALQPASQAAEYFVRLPNSEYGDTIPTYVPFGAIAALLNIEWKDVKPTEHFSEPGFKNIRLDSFGMAVSPAAIASLILDGFDVRDISLWPGP